MRPCRSLQAQEGSDEKKYWAAVHRSALASRHATNRGHWKSRPRPFDRFRLCAPTLRSVLAKITKGRLQAASCSRASSSALNTTTARNGCDRRDEFSLG